MQHYISLKIISADDIRHNKSDICKVEFHNQGFQVYVLRNIKLKAIAQLNYMDWVCSYVTINILIKT